MSVKRQSLFPRETVFAPTESAKRALGVLSPGVSISMITRGQFSLLDLLWAVLDQVGPSDVIISTWTMGVRDAENAEDLLRRGTIRSLRFLVDRSFPTRQPAYAAAVRKRFGSEAFVLSRVHAKFAVILGGALPVVVRSSMNLNKNERWEQADVDVDAGLCAFYAGLVTELGGRLPDGLDTSEAAIDAALRTNWPSKLRAAPVGSRSGEPVSVVPSAQVADSVDAEFESPIEAYWTRAIRELDEWIGGAVEDRSWTAVGQLQGRRDSLIRARLDHRAAIEAVASNAAMNDDAAQRAALKSALDEMTPEERRSLLAVV